MKEQIKASEKIQLSNKEIANLSDAEFKSLVIMMLTKMTEHDCKIEGRLCKVKYRKMYREPTVMGRKLGIK